MKILIIDDNIDKVRNIGCVIRDLEYKEIEYDYALEIIDAKRKMINTYYDLVILDIMLPNRIDTEVEVDGGIRLLNEIISKDKYKYPGIIIGMTADKDIIKEHKYNFFSIIHYEESYSSWKIELDKYIRLAIERINRLENRREIDYKYDVAIVCALEQVELTPIIEIFNLEKKIRTKNDDSTYYEGKMNIKGKELKVVATSCNSMGLTSAAVASMKIIEKYRPRYLFMTGICAGVKGKTEFGDIIIADPIWNYGNGKYVNNNGSIEFLPSPSQLRLDVTISGIIDSFKLDNELLKNIKRDFENDKPKHELRCLKGAFASGEAVLATSKKIDSVKEQERNLLGIDMESYSVHYAGQYCTKLKPKVVTLKSVCDFGDEEKGNEYQSYAAHTSAKFLHILIEKLVDELDNN